MKTRTMAIVLAGPLASPMSLCGAVSAQTTKING